MNMNLWVAARATQELTWSEFIGVFSTEEAAVAACSQLNDMVGPIALDVAQPDEKVIWPGAYYPLARDSENTETPAL